MLRADGSVRNKLAVHLAESQDAADKATGKIADMKPAAGSPQLGSVDSTLVEATAVQVARDASHIAVFVIGYDASVGYGAGVNGGGEEVVRVLGDAVAGNAAGKVGAFAAGPDLTTCDIAVVEDAIGVFAGDAAGVAAECGSGSGGFPVGDGAVGDEAAIIFAGNATGINGVSIAHLGVLGGDGAVCDGAACDVIVAEAAAGNAAGIAVLCGRGFDRGGAGNIAYHHTVVFLCREAAEAIAHNPAGHGGVTIIGGGRAAGVFRLNLTAHNIGSQDAGVAVFACDAPCQGPAVIRGNRCLDQAFADGAALDEAIPYTWHAVGVAANDAARLASAAFAGGGSCSDGGVGDGAVFDVAVVDAGDAAGGVIRDNGAAGHMAVFDAAIVVPCDGSRIGGPATEGNAALRQVQVYDGALPAHHAEQPRIGAGYGGLIDLVDGKACNGMALAVKGALVGVIVVPDRNPEGLSQIHITAQGDAGIQQSIRKGAPKIGHQLGQAGGCMDGISIWGSGSVGGKRIVLLLHDAGKNC